MSSKIAVYDTHEKAVKAIKALVDNGISTKQISLIAKAEVTNNHVHHINNRTIEESTAFIGMGAGVLAGLLSGIGVFAIPGFGFLYGAGAVVGVLGGFDLGIMAGGLGALAEVIGFKDEKIGDYEKHLNKGSYFVIFKGSSDDVDRAEKILGSEGSHFMLD
ncbi:MAG: hypothetical protein JKX68_01620 [Flavobacteriales bacterium]|nr:hypothetical protein [Flavobacteriales bacterium]